MKVGMIFECGPQGADVGVCTTLARKISPNIVIEHATLGNKKILVDECGVAARALLSTGCEKVIIVWDLYPAWRENRERPCRHEDRETIFQSLANADVNLNKVALVCIQEELEAWLIADGRALSSHLSRPAHPVTIGDIKNVERISNPKKRLMNIFKQNTGRPYSDSADAPKIAKAIPDFSRLEKVPTFARFMEKVK